MKRRIFIPLITLTAIIFCLVSMAAPVIGQRNQRTDSRILYHDGFTMTSRANVYFVWYGSWPQTNTTIGILTDALLGLGGSPYFRINTTYPNGNGSTPNEELTYAGFTYDEYSHGPTLTIENLHQILEDKINSGTFPLDTTGIYIIIGSADVTDVRSDGTTFCTPGTSPHHSTYVSHAVDVKYAFIGDAARCPTSVGPQFYAPDGTRLATPNGNFAADAMASTLARLLNVIVTSPYGTDGPIGGWYDRYGLENSDKCVGKFGTTYATSNGARANMWLWGRHFLIQQNWVNDRKGRCALAYP